MSSKYNHIIIFLFLIFSQPLMADINSVMMKGNEFYKNGKYQLAVEEYNKLLNNYKSGTSLFYNLGNAYYRLGKIGYAVLYYEKALKLSPGDEDVSHNLELVKLSLKDKIDTLPPFFIFNIWEGLLAAFSVTGWTIILYIFYLLLLASIVAYFFSGSVSLQRLSFFTGAALGVLFLISVSLLAVKINKEFNIKFGVIVEGAVTVKSSPDSSSGNEFVIHEGLKIKLEDKVDNWIKIRLEDGKVGWIENKNAAEI